MNEYEIYKKSLGNVPTFLNKYLELDIVQRLKGISLLCGMDYASRAAYDFDYYISRYDHSLNVALITWNMTHDKTQTLAGLFHDISTPVFSHVIDYLNHDYVNQESTEEKTKEILNSSWELKKYLNEDGIKFDDICDFKKYSVVDLERPSLCADRLDGTLAAGINWTKTVSGLEASRIIDNLFLTKNEKGKDEIAFKDEECALTFTSVNDTINKASHSNVDNFMMNLLSDIVRDAINLKIVDYDSLFYITEEEFIQCVEDNLDLSEELNRKWYLFKNVKEFPKMEYPKVKNKIINPLVVDKRLK